MFNGFHVQDGLVFKRLLDGSVRIQKHADAKEDSPITTEFVIDKRVWCSVIAQMSAGSEIDNRFYAAEAFHESLGPVGVVALGRPSK